MLLLKHHIPRTYFDTCQTSRAGIRIHDINAVFEPNGILRAVIGAHAALVAKMDAVIPRSGEACLYS